MGECAPWIRQFKDIFDTMMEATVNSMQDLSADDEELHHPVVAAHEADFSTLGNLNIDHVAPDLAKELVEWMQH